MIRLLSGDCRSVLATLPADSVQCVVTSPPYFGLRDYQTGTWDGGDAACDHIQQPYLAKTPKIAPHGGYIAQVEKGYRHICGKCGAVRIDRQIGLEPTPEAYLQTMVEVFREIRRVLRPDGTCFINLGDSYASGGTRPSQSPSRGRALACDSGGTAPADYPGPDYACRDLCDGCSVALSSRNGTYQPPPRSQQLGVTTDHDSGRLYFAGEVATVVPLAALASTSPVSSLQPRGLCSHCANCGACLSVLRSSSRDARECVRSSWLNIPYAGHTTKPKDLLMMPARLALALQADGWWVRSDIIIAKKNPMPESCRDRPTSAHEHVFLLTKNARYYFDPDAVRENAVADNREAFRGAGSYVGGNSHNNGSLKAAFGRGHVDGSGTRNIRNVWDISTEAFSGAHFATMPTSVVKRAIKSGTSERGCCAQCGKPWGRVTERATAFVSGSGKAGNLPNGKGRPADGQIREGHDIRMGNTSVVTTTGWQPGCAHNADIVPCTVLDPFAGAGTSLLVADRLQRDAIGIELNVAYTQMAMDRVRADAPLFADMADAPVPEHPEDQQMADLFEGDEYQRRLPKAALTPRRDGNRWNNNAGSDGFAPRTLPDMAAD